MSKKRSIVYFAGAALCVGYYFAMGLFSRFGLAQSWVWFFFAAILCIGGIGSLIDLPKAVRILWRTFFCIGMAVMIALMGFVVTGWTARLPEHLDYLIILGARVDPGSVPSKSLQRRLTAAEKYLANEPDTLVIASGGKGSDEEITEAQCIFDALTKAGIAPERVLMEEDSMSTTENFENCRSLVPEGAKVGFITNNYHVRRSQLLAQRAGFEEISAGAAPFEGILPLHFVVRECIGIVVQFLKGELG